MKHLRYTGLGLIIVCIAAIAVHIQKKSTSTGDCSLIQGEAEISNSTPEKTLTIHQSSKKAIIRTESGFFVNSGKLHITSDHPNPTTIVIDESGNPSRLFGKLTSDGELFVINPKGLIVGPHSEIDLNQSIVESTLEPASE